MRRGVTSVLWGRGQGCVRVTGGWCWATSSMRGRVLGDHMRLVGHHVSPRCAVALRTRQGAYRAGAPRRVLIAAAKHHHTHPSNFECVNTTHCQHARQSIALNSLLAPPPHAPQ
jgi:hypothetical protein